MEEALLESTRDYYARKRQEWINVDSTPDYLVKAETCLEEETTRVADYLNPSTEAKLLKVVEEELLEKVEMVLLEKEGSGCHVLLANDKSEDLQRMFRLFSQIGKWSQSHGHTLCRISLVPWAMISFNQRKARLGFG